LDLARYAKFGSGRSAAKANRGGRDILGKRGDTAVDADASGNIDGAAKAADLHAVTVFAGIKPVADDGAVDDQTQAGPGSRNRTDGDRVIRPPDANGRSRSEGADRGRAFLVVVDPVLVLVLVAR